MDDKGMMMQSDAQICFLSICDPYGLIGGGSMGVVSGLICMELSFSTSPKHTTFVVRCRGSLPLLYSNPSINPTSLNYTPFHQEENLASG